MSDHSLISDMVLSMIRSRDDDLKYHRGMLVGMVFTIMEIEDMDWSLSCQYVVNEFLKLDDRGQMIPRECIPDGWELYFNLVMASETKEVSNVG